MASGGKDPARSLGPTTAGSAATLPPEAWKNEAAAALKIKREKERLEREQAEASKAKAQGKKHVTHEVAEQGSGPFSCAC